ncbi:LysR family transcriptional regulator [Sporolactobacillus sp. CQH2019]|uniref:LysR family transcriptional regulator n=1 Tax=Sporolactobacillus sp. CQH2019 TaxID=3023512 RepID=UPI002367BFEF|nr:LysR family transcriptional regulator [Sporolactobacillus sp. CQH2019]MDD9147517.1 LysR family transcriptional regulator [Sporolactobacillus sp. CQH2019]
MELYQIKYVLAVAKHQNFTNAAAELCITPSTLSQQIKKFEDELGVELFSRSTRHVQLTPGGLEFVERTKRIVGDLDDSEKAMKKFALGLKGQLSVGSTPAMKVFGIIHLISAFGKQYPNISIQLHEAECFDLYPPLDAGKIDLAFLTAFKSDCSKQKLDAFPIAEDELVLVTSLDHPFAKRKTIDLKEAADESFIILSPTSGLYQDTLEACHSVGFKPHFTFTTKYVDTCMGLVSENAAIACVSSKTVLNTLWKNVAIVHLKQHFVRTLFLVIPHNNKSPVVRNFKKFLFDHLDPSQLPKKVE